MVVALIHFINGNILIAALLNSDITLTVALFHFTCDVRLNSSSKRIGTGEAQARFTSIEA